MLKVKLIAHTPQPEKVVAAEDMEVIATFAIPVTLLLTEQAAIKTEPCILINDCMRICPME